MYGMYWWAYVDVYGHVWECLGVHMFSLTSKRNAY